MFRSEKGFALFFFSETPLKLLQPDGSNQNSTTEGEGRIRLAEVAGPSVDEAVHESICLSSPRPSIQSRTVHSKKQAGS